MAWCPKCKNEYVDGITTCTDCNVELVDSLDDIVEYKQIFINGFDDFDNLIDYLHELGIESAHKEFSEEENCEVIAVLPKDYTDAKIHITVYVQNELPYYTDEESEYEESGEYEESDISDESNGDNDSADGYKENLNEEDDMTSSESDDDGLADSEPGNDLDAVREHEKDHNFMVSDKSTSYVHLADKYEDVKSSAYTLLVVGTLGLVALIFEIAGMYTIPFNTNTKWLFYFVFGGILTACVIGGIISMMRATTLKIEAEKEDQMIKDILTWFSENVTPEEIDKNIDLDVQEELLYFNRADYIKETIMHQFENADEPLVESLIEKIYSSYYE